MNASTTDPLDPPARERFADLQIEVGQPQVIGAGVRGTRRLVPILGGAVQGQGWQARVLPGGTDFQLILNDGMSELDARYGLETDGGDLIYVQNHALRTAAPEVMARLLRGEPVDPGEVYFRCTPRLETRSTALGWVNERLFVGVGVRRPAAVLLRFFTLL